MTPIAITGPKGLRYEGTARTTIYTGSFSAGACSGTYNGPLGGDDLIIAMQCSDGRYGMGRGRQVGGRFAGGTVTLSDGTQITIAPTGPEPNYAVVPGGLTSQGWQLPARDAIVPSWLR